ncbi:unnamed protein product [Ilex paraguariensis]|uniref:Uncharacterized protein n=1 Tax=Ilex paraguariensis TaxID=185542 RepID=A0ABC8S854_9AQUA
MSTRKEMQPSIIIEEETGSGQAIHDEIVVQTSTSQKFMGQSSIGGVNQGDEAPMRYQGGDGGRRSHLGELGHGDRYCPWVSSSCARQARQDEEKGEGGRKGLRRLFG